MRKKLVPYLAIAAAAALLALPLLAARPMDDALLYVPADAATVGMIRVSDLRTSPLFTRLFEETDKLTVDGDAARFMEDARLDVRHDVDVVVVAGSPKAGKAADGTGLVVFEGRFDPDRLASALVARGAVKTNDFFLLPDRSKKGKENDGVIALVDRHFVVAGSEEAVKQALAQRAAGGSGFAAGSGLGRELSRIDGASTAWALLDTARFPEMKERAARMRLEGDVNGRPMPNILGAMKSVSLMGVQASVKGDSLKLDATAVSEDSETRELIEDTVKGALAAARLAMQDDADAVAVLRRFKVANGKDAVTVSGTLPGAAVRAIAERGHARKAAGDN
jgi:hypothetical protein